MFTNLNWRYNMLLSILDDRGRYLIMDVSVTDSQPYVTHILSLNATYTLELRVEVTGLRTQSS